MAGKPHNFILLSSILLSFNDGPRTQKEREPRVWMRGKLGPQLILSPFSSLCSAVVFVGFSFKTTFSTLIPQYLSSYFPMFFSCIIFAPHSSTLASKIPWMEEPCRLQSTGLLRTERLHFHFLLSCIGEGNGNPLQYPCLENPRDSGAWPAAVYGVTQS